MYESGRGAASLISAEIVKVLQFLFKSVGNLVKSQQLKNPAILTEMTCKVVSATMKEIISVDFLRSS